MLHKKLLLLGLSMGIVCAPVKANDQVKVVNNQAEVIIGMFGDVSVRTGNASININPLGGLIRGLIGALPEGFKQAIKVGAGVAVVCGVAGAAVGGYLGWHVLKNINNDEFTPDDERKESDVAFVFSNGLGNPRLRCGVVLSHSLPSALCPALVLLQYPKYFNGRFFVTHPKHLFASRSDEAHEWVKDVADRPEIQKIVRIGHSCGASDAIVELCTKEQPAKVKAVLAIAPFAHTDDIVDNWVGWVPVVNWIARKVTAHLVLRKFNGYQPIDMIEQASAQAKQIPVRVVASTGDWIVPATSSQRLVKAMRQEGFDDVSVEVHANWLAGHDFGFISNDKTATNAWLNRVLADQESVPTAAV